MRVEIEREKNLEGLSPSITSSERESFIGYTQLTIPEVITVSTEKRDCEPFDSPPRPEGRGLLKVHPEPRFYAVFKGGASRGRTGEKYLFKDYHSKSGSDLAFCSGASGRSSRKHIRQHNLFFIREKSSTTFKSDQAPHFQVAAV